MLKKWITIADPWLVFQLPEIDLRLEWMKKQVHILIENESFFWKWCRQTHQSCVVYGNLHECLVVVANLLNMHIEFRVNKRL